MIQCETITRCRNCRSYINPFVQFIDNAHWKCNLCYRVNECVYNVKYDIINIFKLYNILCIIYSTWGVSN